MSAYLCDKFSHVVRAALLQQFREPLRIDDVPRPQLAAGQVLIKVAACGACHSDVHLAQGEWEAFKSRMPMPLVLGHEVAGTVAEVGSGVKHLQEGDTVGVPWFYFTCGHCEYCRKDLEVFCDIPQVTGVTVHGGFAEYMVAWESHAIPIPKSLPLAEAAPLFCAGGTVFSALSKVNLDGSTHLGIWGAGGLGHYGIQLGKLADACVTVVDLVPEKLSAAKDLGADVAITAEAAAQWFKDPKNKVDVALVCATSAEAYQAAFHSLKRSGVMLVVGIPSQPLSWMAGDLIRSGVRVVPSRVASRAELRELVRLAAAGSIHSEIREYPLDSINEVMAQLQAGQIFGRSVITF
ncbi:MAG: alcohol dehydrogenase catalytic domain-containing protein [Acidobacteria bacterium]|nr:alcohol dehydrogenase catalytic domain-containing protein [Acidobacteriota bacterium]